MQQVQHGFELTAALQNSDASPVLKDSITAQLSHSDGIRGFMVSYLTAEGNTVADANEIPQVLLDALLEQAEQNPDDLIPLACESSQQIQSALHA